MDTEAWHAVVHGVAMSWTLGKGVDVGIIPKTGDLQLISPEHIDALIGAGGAANMQKGLHSSLQMEFLTIIPLIKNQCKGLPDFPLLCARDVV